MKTKVLIVAIVASISIFCYLDNAKTESNGMADSYQMGLYDIEALTNCEAIDGHKNDGHCVSNDRREYFCAKPGFLQSRNCAQ